MFWMHEAKITSKKTIWNSKYSVIQLNQLWAEVSGEEAVGEKERDSGEKDFAIIFIICGKYWLSIERLIAEEKLQVWKCPCL